MQKPANGCFRSQDRRSREGCSGKAFPLCQLRIVTTWHDVVWYSMERSSLVIWLGSVWYGGEIWKGVPPGNMISPPAANLIVRNREEIRGCGRLTVYQSGSRRVYIGTLSLWSALSRGTTGHKGLFFAADPLSRLLLSFLFRCFRFWSTSRLLLFLLFLLLPWQKPVLNLRSVHCMRRPLLLPGFCWIWDARTSNLEKIGEEENSHRLLFDREAPGWHQTVCHLR